MVKIILVILIIIVFVGKTRNKNNIYTENESNIPMIYNPADDENDIECIYPDEQLTNFNPTILKYADKIERETITRETIYFK